MKLFRGRKASIDLSKKSGTKWGNSAKYGLSSLMVGATLLSLILAVHFYLEVSKLQASIGKSTVPQAATADPVAEVIVAVEKHLLLPQREQPKVARITSLASLTNIPFFGNALTGDVVLVYCKTSLSVLYSPSRDKVIEVSRQLVGGSCAK